MGLKTPVDYCVDPVTLFVTYEIDKTNDLVLTSRHLVLDKDKIVSSLASDVSLDGYQPRWRHYHTGNVYSRGLMK